MEEPAKTRPVENTAANARVVGRAKDVKVRSAGGGRGGKPGEKGGESVREGGEGGKQ